MQDRTQLEARVVDALEAWTDAGRRLLQYDPEKFQQILSITRAFVALFERGVEEVEVYRSRIAQFSPRKSKVLS